MDMCRLVLPRTQFYFYYEFKKFISWVYSIILKFGRVESLRFSRVLTFSAVHIFVLLLLF